MFAHNLGKDALHYGCNEAGLSHPNEPTHTKLLHQVHEDHIDKFFPKHATEENVERACKFITDCLTINTMPLGTARAAAARELARKLAASGAPAKGLRLDVYIRPGPEK